MPVYMVERNLPGVQMNQLAAAQKAAIEMSREFTASGKDVRYLRTTFVPSEAHCMCLFEADTAHDSRGERSSADSLYQDR